MYNGPLAWFFVIESGLPRETAETLQARLLSRPGSGRVHIQGWGFKWYIIAVDKIAVAGAMKVFLERHRVKFEHYSMGQLAQLSSTGDAEVDEAILHCVTELFGGFHS